MKFFLSLCVLTFSFISPWVIRKGQALEPTPYQDQFVDLIPFPRGKDVYFSSLIRAESFALRLKNDPSDVNNPDTIVERDTLELKQVLEVGLSDRLSLGSEVDLVLSQNYAETSGPSLQTTTKTQTGANDPVFFSRYRFLGQRGLGRKGDVILRFGPDIVGAEDEVTSLGFRPGTLGRGGSLLGLGLNLGVRKESFELVVQVGADSVGTRSVREPDDNITYTYDPYVIWKFKIEGRHEFSPRAFFGLYIDDRLTTTQKVKSNSSSNAGPYFIESVNQVALGASFAWEAIADWMSLEMRAEYLDSGRLDIVDSDGLTMAQVKEQKGFAGILGLKFFL